MQSISTPNVPAPAAAEAAEEEGGDERREGGEERGEEGGAGSVMTTTAATGRDKEGRERAEQGSREGRPERGVPAPTRPFMRPHTRHPAPAASSS